MRIAFNNEVAVPPLIQPDMPFPARIDIDGEGLADEEITITLQVYKPVAGVKDDEEITEEPKRKPDLEITPGPIGLLSFQHLTDRVSDRDQLRDDPDMLLRHPFAGAPLAHGDRHGQTVEHLHQTL